MICGIYCSNRFTFYHSHHAPLATHHSPLTTHHSHIIVVIGNNQIKHFDVVYVTYVCHFWNISLNRQKESVNYLWSLVIGVTWPFETFHMLISQAFKKLNVFYLLLKQFWKVYSFGKIKVIEVIYYDQFTDKWNNNSKLAIKPIDESL